MKSHNKRPIRVIQLISGLAIGDRDGGAEYFGLQLARFLNKQEQDIEAAVFVMWYSDSQVERKWLAALHGEALEVGGLVAPGGYPPRDLPLITKRLWAFVDQFRPDIINTHSQRGDLIAVAMSLLHPVHPRAVRTVHIDQPWLNRFWADVVFNRGLFPFVFDAEIAVSETVRRKLDRRLVARAFGKKSIVCYNGIDARFFRRDSFSREARPKKLPLGVPDVYPRIGAIGRLVKQKGLCYLIQAMRIVNQHRTVHLLVIGSGPLESDLRRQVQELGLADRVHFLGNRQDVMQILPHLDLVVSSSLWEGLSTVLLEAMAMRVPVVATCVSGSCEIIRHGETGLLVPPGDPESLAQAIVTILDDPAEAQRMAERAYDVARNYTIQGAARRYAEIYRCLVRGNRSAGSLDS